jgi:hypothetical protein
MSRIEWHQLITTLAAIHPDQRRRGPAPALTLAEKTLATVLRLRFSTPQHALADLFGVAIRTISQAQQQILPLLDQHHTTPTDTTLTTLPDLTTYAATAGLTLKPKIKPTC